MEKSSGYKLHSQEHRFKIIRRESEREYIVNRPADLRRLMQETVEKIQKGIFSAVGIEQRSTQSP